MLLGCRNALAALCVLRASAGLEQRPDVAGPARESDARKEPVSLVQGRLQVSPPGQLGQPVTVVPQQWKQNSTNAGKVTRSGRHPGQQALLTLHQAEVANTLLSNTGGQAPLMNTKSAKAQFGLAFVVPLAFACFAWLVPQMHDLHEAKTRVLEDPQEVVPSEDLATRKPQPLSMFALVRKMSPLWLVLILTAVSFGISGPSSNYVGMNFFAGHHTNLPRKQIHCELDPASIHCRLGVLDYQRINSYVGLVSPIVSIILGPALGSLSDSVGRRPVLAVVCALQLIPGIAVVSFLYHGSSLYLYYWLIPLADIPVQSISYAYCVDCVGDPHSIAKAFGLMSATHSFCKLVGMLIGQKLALIQSYTIGYAINIVCVAYIVFVLPESLPLKDRTPLKRSSLLPGVSLQILFRNPLLMRLTYIALLAHFVDSGGTAITGAYLQLYMRWTMRNTYVGDMLGSVSSILWMTFGMGTAIHWLGEAGVLSLSRWACIIYTVIFLFASKLSTIYFLQIFGWGPISLSFPILASLKGQAVSPAEQGLIQAALNTVTTVVASLGPVSFSIIFRSTNDASGIRTRASNTTLIFEILLALPILMTVPTLKPFMKRYLYKEKNQNVSRKLVKVNH